MAATDTAETAQEAGNAGMPQLDFTTFPNQIFWLVVTLLVIYFVLSRIALPRIGGVLAERKGVITNDLTAADELKHRAVLAEKTYNDALVRARAEASKIVNEAKAAIQKDLNKAIALADTEIAAKSAESETRIGEIRAGALDAISQVAKDTASALVSALGGSADAKSVAAAVTLRLKG